MPTRGESGLISGGGFSVGGRTGKGSSGLCAEWISGLSGESMGGGFYNPITGEIGDASSEVGEGFCVTVAGPLEPMMYPTHPAKPTTSAATTIALIQIGRVSFIDCAMSLHR
jgi:hypothetical protein